MKRLWWMALVLVLLLVACGPDGDAEDDSPSTTAAAAAAEDLVEADPATNSGSGTESEESPEESAVTPSDADEDAEEPDGDSGIAAVTSGRFEDRLWVKFELVDPVPDQSEQVIFRYELFIRSSEDDAIGVRWTLPEQGDPFTSSFCLGETPSCPDGIFPVEAVVGDDLDEITFFMPGDAFANSTDIMISASVQTGAISADDLTTERFRDGEQLPLSTVEGDPC